eukprot:scaffold2850_cov119-Isochrysis_galbana.AAC.2
MAPPPPRGATSRTPPGAPAESEAPAVAAVPLPRAWISAAISLYFATQSRVGRPTCCAMRCQRSSFDMLAGNSRNPDCSAACSCALHAGAVMASTTRSAAPGGRSSEPTRARSPPRKPGRSCRSV